MAKSKTSPIPSPTTDLDFDLETTVEVSTADGNPDASNEANGGDDFLDSPMAPSLPATGMNVMDFSDFMSGIEDITLESESHVKGLIYGPNGTGKTTTAGTFPGPRLILDINERGTKPLVGTVDSKKRFVDTFDMFIMAYWYLKSGNHPFKTVIIDNVTTLQELAMRYVMKKDGDIDLSKDMDMPTKRDWGGLSQVMKRWLIDFRNLPMNVVFIAQEKRNNDDDVDSDDVSVFPQVSTSVRGILGAAVDFIGRTYVVEVSKSEQQPDVLVPKFCMRITPNSKYLAKIRVPTGAKVPASIANPSYASLQKIMTGEYGIKK